MAKTVRRIEAKSAVDTARKRVAAYARVSMETDRLEHSLSRQISYYSDLIQRHPGWEYAGVFADNGISGTSTNRPEFQRMIAECEAGHIDIILTKSFSRFARNTLDMLVTIRRLKELGISVRFEKEGIDTLTESGELLLTLVAFVQGRCGEAELKTARDEYSSFLEKSRALKAKLAAEHTEH